VNTGKNVGGFVGATLRGCPITSNNICPDTSNNNCPKTSNNICPKTSNTLGEHIGSPLQQNDTGKLDIGNVNTLNEWFKMITTNEYNYFNVF
jgi:hypothetical protein